jgi:hypothetical protein
MSINLNDFLGLHLVLLWLFIAVHARRAGAAAQGQDDGVLAVSPPLSRR